MADETPDPGYFGAAKATLVLAAFFVAQIAASFVVLFFGMVFAAARGASLGTPGLIERVTNDSLIVMLFATIFAGAIAIALSIAIWGQPLFARTGVTGLGARRGTVREQAVALVVGLVLGGAWLYVAKVLIPIAPDTPTGPLARVAQTSGIGRIAWVIVAIVLAPAIEEVLFRGVLLAGYARRFGLVAASIVVTVVFVAMHLPETWHYAPATVAVAMLAVVLLVLRVWSDSVWVSSIAHVAYNGTIAAALAWS